jgi:hypothetical protein
MNQRPPIETRLPASINRWRSLLLSSILTRPFEKQTYVLDRAAAPLHHFQNSERPGVHCARFVGDIDNPIALPHIHVWACQPAVRRDDRSLGKSRITDALRFDDQSPTHGQKPDCPGFDLSVERVLRGHCALNRAGHY